MVKEELRPCHLYVLDHEFHNSAIPPDVHSVTSCVCQECQKYISDLQIQIDKRIVQLEQSQIMAATNSTRSETDYTLGGSGSGNEMSEGSRRKHDLQQKKVDKMIAELCQQDTNKYHSLR